MAQAYSFMAEQPNTQQQAQWNPSEGLPAGQTSTGPPSTFTGGATGGDTGWKLPTWNPTMPTNTYSFDSGQQRNPGQGDASIWADRVGGSDALFNDWNYREPNTPYSRMLENSLPWSQFLQNASQYRQDYNEAQRRWNIEQGWGQGMDTAQFGLASRQQMSAEEQARIAAQQWGQQFDWTRTTDQWNRDLSQQQLTNTNAYQMGLIGNQQTEMGNTAAYQKGLLGNSAQEIANTGLYQQGQLANTQYANQATAQYQQGLVANQQQANQIEQAYRSGLISNEQRSLALQELTQRQTFGLQTGTLAEQVRAAQAQEALRQQEINQQLQIAAMQAYGRSQAPNARWSRSWA